jgi:hypothetical protein
MFCNFRLGIAALVAVTALAVAAEAQVKPFKITGSGTALTGLPLPGQDPRDHDIVGNATHLGRYTGIGSVQTESAAPNPQTGTIQGKFGSGSVYTFVAANGDKLVTIYGRDEDGVEGEAIGDFELTPVGVTEDGDLIVTAAFIADFVVQPELSTGKFSGVTGSWTMYAFTEPFVLGSMDPAGYRWEGEGELTFPKKD